MQTETIPTGSGPSVLPHSQEAEASVLGGILLQPKAFLDVAGAVTPAEFFNPVHAAIFQAMADLDGAKKPIDSLTVAEQMRASETFGALRCHNGEGYFGELMSAVITAENIAWHAKIVRDKAASRRLIETASEVRAAGLGGMPADELRELAERGVLGISIDDGERTPRLAAESLRTLADRLEDRKGRGGVTGVPTPFEQLNVLLGGLGKRRATVLGARPKMGKTSLVGALVEHAAVDKRIPTLAITLEVNRVDFVDGIVARRGNVNTMRMAAGQPTQAEWLRILSASSSIAAAPLMVTDKARTLTEIRSTVRRWRMREGAGDLALVTVDYLQRVRHEGKKGWSRDNEVTEISNGLVSLANEADVAMLIVASLNRECERREDKRPEPSDLRDSGSIESDADAVSFLYRDAVYNKDANPKDAELIVRLNRFGPTGTVHLRWTPESTRFDEVAA